MKKKSKKEEKIQKKHFSNYIEVTCVLKKLQLYSIMLFSFFSFGQILDLPSIDLNKYNVYDSPEEIGTSSGLTNPKFYSAKLNGEINPVFRYSQPMRIESTYPYYVDQKSSRKLGYMTEFYADTRWIEFIGWHGITRFTVEVDGIIITGRVLLTNTLGDRYFRIDLGSKKKRHIKIGIYNRFKGVNVDEDGEITAVDQNKLLLVAEGDSIVEGTTASLSEMYFFSWPGIVAQKLNFDFINSAVGGSGYVRGGNQNQPNMLNRVDNYVVSENPDIFLGSAGFNDGYKSTDGDEIVYMETVKNNIDKYWGYLKEKLPNTYLIVCSLFNPFATISKTNLEINSYLKQAALDNNLPFIDFTTKTVYDNVGNIITQGSEGIITGTGNAGSTIDPNDGNRYEFISADNIHPTKEGLRYTGIWASNEIYKLLQNSTTSTKNNLIEGFATYPNPVTNSSFIITSNSADKKEVIIFNVLGKKVISTSFLGTKSDINVEAISSGIYILKVSEGSKIATSKLIIK